MIRVSVYIVAFNFQYWKDKAAELKQQLVGSDVTTPKKSVPKQQAKPDKKGKSHAKSSHSKSESLPATPTTQPIDMAAHLKLLGESLTTVGLLLKQQVYDIHVRCRMCIYTCVVFGSPEIYVLYR